MKREFRTRPTENRFANGTPLRFCWHFNNHDSGFIYGRILKCNEKIATVLSEIGKNARKGKIPTTRDVATKVTKLTPRKKKTPKKLINFLEKTQRKSKTK